MIEEYLPFFKDTPDGKQGLQLDMDLMRSKRIMVLTPCFGGQSMDAFNLSFTALALECQRVGIHLECARVYGESDISRARNRLAAEFMASDCSEAWWWDNDEKVGVRDLFTMSATNLSLVGAPVPFKCEQERYAINYLPDGTKPMLNGAIQVETIGTGLLMEQRRVFETMIERGEVDKLTGLDNFERKGADDWYYTFFHPSWDVLPTASNVEVFTGADGKEHTKCGNIIDGKTNWHTEDYTHCKKWNACGGRTWLWPYAKVGHWGGKMYEGNFLKQ